MLRKSVRLSPARNYGIDLLRLVSMFYVVILHVLGQGGILSATTGTRRAAAWVLEVLAYCAVDCYAIISGFVGYSDREKPYPYQKYISLWLQVFFYSFGLTLAVFLCKPGSIAPKDLVRAIFPAATNQYWYFSAYTGLFFLIPLLNRLVRGQNPKELTRSSLMLMALFSLVGTFSSAWESDAFRLSKGYSLVWLVILYLIGAWMKRCDIASRIRKPYGLLLGAGCILLSWFLRVYVSGVPAARVLVSYISPTILLVSMIHVALFSRLSLPDWAKRWIQFFSPAAFGVYLIHTQKSIWEYYFKNAFVRIAKVPVAVLPIAVLLCALAVFLLCLFMEKLRQLLFRVLHIDAAERFVQKIAQRFSKSSL